MFTKEIPLSPFKNLYQADNHTLINKSTFQTLENTLIICLGKSRPAGRKAPAESNITQRKR